MTRPNQPTLEPPDHKRKSLRRLILPIALLVLLFVATTMIGQNNEKTALPPEVKGTVPGVLEPPVQLAFVTVASSKNCRTHDDANSGGISRVCAGWQIRLNYKKGHAPRDVSVPLAESCQPNNVPSELLCSADINLPDAASQAQISKSLRLNLPLLVSPSGRHIVYFSISRSQYIGWDLSTGTLTEVSPLLAPAELGTVTSVITSADGQHFAIGFAGPKPHVRITESANSTVTDILGYCRTLGLSKRAKLIAATPMCVEVGDEGFENPRAVVIRTQNLKPVSEWSLQSDTGDLSWSGKLLAEVRSDATVGTPSLEIYDTTVGRLLRRLKLRFAPESAHISAHGWYKEREYVVESSSEAGSSRFYAVNVDSGSYRRIGGLDVEDSIRVSLGKIE